MVVAAVLGERVREEVEVRERGDTVRMREEEEALFNFIGATAWARWLRGA